MAKTPQMNIAVGPAQLMWIYISGQGKPGLNAGEFKYTATLRFPDAKSAKPFTDQIAAFWKDNKPTGATRAKTNGVKKVMRPTGELDEDDAPIMEETGEIDIVFSTATSWPDGKPKVIKVLNAKGQELALGERKIGNGSVGVVHGIAKIYDREDGKGVSLFLNAVQLKKYVEYTDTIDAADISGDDEDAFKSFDDEMPPVAEPSSPPTSNVDI